MKHLELCLVLLSHRLFVASELTLFSTLRRLLANFHSNQIAYRNSRGMNRILSNGDSGTTSALTCGYNACSSLDFLAGNSLCPSFFPHPSLISSRLIALVGGISNQQRLNWTSVLFFMTSIESHHSPSQSC